ncbi:MAG TPA: surface lipoprotein assembly modifier [Acidobacteriota bacterium]|nr:surface lipoprotein assembly modifier [Acidobacteriota bacterium]
MASLLMSPEDTMRHFALTLLLCMLTLTGVQAQTPTGPVLSGSLTTWLVKDQNSYGIDTRTEYEEWVNRSHLKLGLSFRRPSHTVDLSYQGDVSLYHNQSAQSNLSHGLNLQAKATHGKYMVFLNGSTSFRRNRSEYDYYNVDSYNARLTVRYRPDWTLSFNGGLTVSHDDYRGFEELDNVTYTLFANARRSFQSRWSLLGQTALTLKKYPNQTVTSDPTSGPGGVSRTKEEPVEAALFRVHGSVARSISDKTGLSVELGGQWFLGSPIETFIDSTYYYTENDIYDDAHSYQAEYVGARLTRQFTVSFVAKLSARIAWKSYTGTPALDETGALAGETREDRRSEASLFLSKDFQFELIGPTRLGVYTNFTFRDNTSNDPYHDFDDNTFALGVSLKF